MSDFTMQVKIDPGSAKTDIKSLEDVVKSLESSGKSAGTAMATGMREGSTAAAAAADAVKRTTNEQAQFEVMVTAGNRALAAEADMLERINGPAAQYEERMTALNSLWDKGTINAQQYQHQVDQLSASLERATGLKQHGPDVDQAAKYNGGATDGSDSFALTSSSALAAAAAVVVLGAGVASLTDHYTELANQAGRLASSTTTVDMALNQQLAVSDKLHASLSSTISLTAAVRAGTDQMSMSMQESDALARGIAEDFALSGKSIEDAGGFMSKFTLAAESGTFGTRELRSMFKELPQLSKDMQVELGKTQSELLAMAKAGEITSTMVVGALTETTEKAAALGAQGETTGQAWQHAKDTIALAIGPMQGLGDVIKEGGQAIAGMIDVGRGLATAIGDIASGATSAYGPISSLIEGVKSLKNLAGDVVGSNVLNEQVQQLKAWAEGEAAYAKIFADLKGDSDKLGKTFDNIGDKITAGLQAAFDKDPTTGGVEKWEKTFDAAADHLATLRAEISGASSAIASLNALGAQGQDVSSEVAKMTAQQAAAQKELNAAMKAAEGPLSLYDTLLNDINKRHQESNEGLAAEATLFVNGAIGLEEYAEGVEKYSRLVNKHWGETAAPTLGPAASIGIDWTAQKQQTDVGNDAYKAMDKQNEADKKTEGELYKQLAGPMLKYQDDLDKINDLHARGKDTEAQYAAEMDGLRSKYLGITNDQAEYAKGIAEITTASDKLHLTADQTAQAIDNWNKKTGQARDVSMGFRDGLKDIEKEMGQGGATAAAKLLTDGFNGVNEALTNLITTGTEDWSKFAKTIETDAVNFALKDLEGGLMGALKGSTSGASQTTAITGAGTTVGAGWYTAITSAGVVVATQLAAAMAGGFLPSATGGLAGIGGASDLGAAAAVTAVPGDALSFHVPGGGGSSGGGRPQITMVVQQESDSRSLQSMMKGPAGRQIMTQQMQQNPRVFRSLLGRRG